jgi:hypothetical protein
VTQHAAAIFNVEWKTISRVAVRGGRAVRWTSRSNPALGGTAFMDGWWSEIDEEIEKALVRNGGLSPADLSREIGLSEAATVSILSRLAAEGKVRMTRVELAAPRAQASAA